MARRRLTEEEKERIANRKWKQKTIYASSESAMRRAQNLTGPRTVEGKKRALANLRVGSNSNEYPGKTHGGYIMKLLDEEEQRIYQEFKEKYLRDFDINDSSDETILELVLIDQVRLYRVMRAQFENPSLDIDRPLTDITNRLNKNLDALGTLRKQRLQQDEKMTAVSIATIAQTFARELMSGGIQDQLEAQQEEEREFLERKRKRERESQTVEAEYEVVDEADESEEERDAES